VSADRWQRQQRGEELAPSVTSLGIDEQVWSVRDVSGTHYRRRLFDRLLAQSGRPGLLRL
jgi:hypothetical protein